MDKHDFKLLLHGIDTLQCAYYLQRTGKSDIDFDSLEEKKESIRQSKKKNPLPIVLGDSEFLLQPYGSSSGYPIIITNRDFRIEMGELNVPNFFVTFTSEALWRDSPYVLHEKFLRWAATAGYAQYKKESLSRVDFSFDYKLSAIDFDEDDFVTYSTKDSKHRESGIAQTFTFGKGDIVLRIYDKVAEIRQQSAKAWFYTLWGEKTDIWRIEWQIRKPVLKGFGITTFEELQERRGNLLHYLAYEHDTLRQPDEDSNRSRWPLHPFWRDLQENIDNLYRLPAYTIDGEKVYLDERMVRMVISIYGYLKKVAAIYSIQRNLETVDLDEIVGQVRYMLGVINEPLAWRADVEQRRKEILLGKW